MDLLERDGVLHRLQELVAGAHEGDGRVALLRGEAGIGKTSVARELTRLVADEAHILWGSCDDLLAARPLGPVRDMAFDEPALAGALGSGDHDRVFEVFFELFSRGLRPTVAVFEDVHWADGATLDLLTSLGRRINRTHTLMVLTFRERVPSDHPLSTVLGDLRQDHVENVELEPLSRDAVMTLSDRTDRGSKVWDLSRGNPFYVTELLSSPSAEVPASVADVVRAHLARLTAKGEMLVQLLSVVPGRMELSLLEEIDASLSDSIGEAGDHGLVELAGDSVAFRHELARTAIESSLAEPVRRELNKKALKACQVLGFDVSRLAHHARQSGDVDAMIRLLPEAARQAAHAQSHREAVMHLEALEPYVERLEPRDRTDLYVLWANEEELTTGRGLKRAMAAVELLRALGDQSRLGEALGRASRSAWYEGDPDLAIVLGEEAAGVLEEVGGEELAEVYADLSRLVLMDFRFELATEYAGRALELAPEQSRARAAALITIGIVENFRDYPSGLEALEEASRIAESLGLAREIQRSRTNAIGSAVQWRDLEEARRLNEAALEIIGDESIALSAWQTGMSAAIDIAAGDYRAAEARFRDLLDVADDDTAFQAVGAGDLAKVLMRKGDPGAGEALERAAELDDAVGQAQNRIAVSTRWAEYLWAFQRRDDSITRCNLEVLEELLDCGTPWLIADLALWLWLDGHIDRIPEQAAEPVQWLGGGEWERAAQWFAGRGIPYEQAVALSLGDTQARLEALRIADRIGATALASRFRRQLRAHGVKGVPRRPVAGAVSNRFGLTRRQTEVLELLVEGLSNVEIAERLFIAPRTVENHVSALLSKLGVSSRQEAATLAGEPGLLD